MADILVLNAGSSSIKFAVFDHGLHQRLSGGVTEIGGAGRLSIGGTSEPVRAVDHAAALGVILAALAGQGIALSGLQAAAHRVVHGGAGLTAPRLVTPEVLKEIVRYVPLAPLHNPHNIAAIRAIAVIAPALPQTASFDTAFHATNPAEAVRFALPSLPDTEDLRRYGFHGLSYTGLVEAMPRLTGSLPRRLLAFHLGNGASACAIVNGRSHCTTMGYSPLDGLTMGTRAGSLDPNAVLILIKRIGLEATQTLLNHNSGLYGLSGGVSDMQALLNDDSETARFAVSHFCYWAIRHAGSLIAAMGGLDAIAFTGGIGEHAAAVRNRILDGLIWAGVQPDPCATGPQLHTAASRVTAWVIPASEERVIAQDALRLLGAE